MDSLRVVWPDKTTQLLTDIDVNQEINIKPENTVPFDYNSLKSPKSEWFKAVEDNLGIDFTHREDNYIDFNRQKLIPYQVSDRGPATAIGDLNGDGKEDIFFGSSRSIASRNAAFHES